ncbi:hypothetical protein PIIN_05645 [Serendipita indica DSM 11827]|uniref:Uncharacterized protein n=1 Tax=Serendipita indica (strain DSM 11827) TaxID=1109443 RepID=G4TK70_SERID|nr:hypothetical protein PIIN_05645 [Serendipita indica DSM 11827]
MNLGRQSISATVPTQIIDVRLDADCNIFTCSTPSGFAVYRSNPLTLVRKREVTGGTLSIILPLHSTSLLFLVGGGGSPRYAPNKVIVWDDAQGKEVAELEFNDYVRGIACRRGLLVVALKRRVIAFEITDTVRWLRQWDTGINEKGLVALATAPGATLLVIPGQQTGHLQLIHLPPCPAPPEDHTPGTAKATRPPPVPPIRRDPVTYIVAHTSSLSSISVSRSGHYVATTSAVGTLVRIWDAQTGQKSHEFRRGTDQAHIYGVAFRPDEKECCTWSDKGTLHFFSLERTNQLSLMRHITALLPVQNNYLNSERAYAKYYLPTPPAHVAHSMSQTNRLGTAHPDAGDEEKWTVGWIEVPADTTPYSSPVKTATPLPSVHGNKGRGRASVPGSPLRTSIDRRGAQSPTSPTRSHPKSPPPPEYQLVALTYTGGWYRLSLPKSIEEPERSGTPEPYQRAPQSKYPRRTDTGSAAGGSSQSPQSRQEELRRRSEPSRRRNSDAQRVDGMTCQVEEFRRFGRWDGWG